MSEIRQDPATREWVIIAKERSRRPSDFAQSRIPRTLPTYSAVCPFCPGNETKTPPQVLEYHKDTSKSWSVRVFPNRFPALSPTGQLLTKRHDGFLVSLNGLGAHEVVVETPEHNQPMALMKDHEVLDVLQAYRERYLMLSQQPYSKLIIIFENHGPAAGTSLEHPHSQIVATPVVPRHLQHRYRQAMAFFREKGVSIYTEIMNRELTAKERIIDDTNDYAVFHPFASQRPFETWIMPKVSRASFGDVPLSELRELASVLHKELYKLRIGLQDPDYNFVIDTAPVRNRTVPYYSWHIRIIPHLQELAGFEIGSGIYINTAVPEETAEFMRNISATSEASLG
ncbi:MAG: galactose-1-phosphate uridylyltransferase [Chloroflexota bacterium]